MRTALYYEMLSEEKAHCNLCPQNCMLREGERGVCGVRKLDKGRLITENFGLISSIQSDPIEKKPLYHFYPGRKILSIGSIGCNLSCYYCQNCEISQTSPDSFMGGAFYEPHDIVQLAKKDPENLGIAFTYNEPTIFYEFMLETARLNMDTGLKNVVISNGYINTDPLKELLPFIHAFNIDLKAFTDTFYKSVTKGHLRPVKNTLKEISSSKSHLEITFLLIPSLNDDMKHFKEMLHWIRDELREDVVLHISRYFPAYRSEIAKTSLSLMFRFFEEAKKQLKYVYLGNVTGSESQNTICSACGRMVLSRNGYFIQKNGLDDHGDCVHCGNKIIVC